MDDKTQKERLEQELRFLKESFEAEVISREEFEKGKDRIEKKLREIQGSEKEKFGKKEETGVIEPNMEEKQDAPAEKKEEEKIKLNIIQQDDYAQNDSEEAINADDSTKPMEEPASFPEKKNGKFWKYAVAFIVLILVAYFSYSTLKITPAAQEMAKQTAFVAACNSDNDCTQEGKNGFCMNAGAKGAKCGFREVEKENVIVLNDRKNCFNCDTQRVLSILESWFGPLNSDEIDYNTIEGKNLAANSDAKMLPMYILDENISKNHGFENVKAIFTKKGSNYVLSDSAAASPFYFRRDILQNRLDFFAVSGDSASMRAEKNMKEFLAVFKDIKFEKHLQDDSLTKELGIKNFPSFLINDRIKFTGVQSAETIKENFCKMNRLPQCNISLSRSLV